MVKYMDINVIKKELLKLSNKALKRNEMPVSAILVQNNKIIAKAYNKKNILKNVLFHAEILCIVKACKKLKRWNLSDCTLYVSLEPCDLCKEVIQESRIRNVFYILKKGNISNKYAKTKYEQVYDFDSAEFEVNVKKFFEFIRK